jgi:hypothetical protein
MMMEAVCTSETSVYFSETTRRYIPEVYQLHTRRRENLNSHFVIFTVFILFKKTSIFQMRGCLVLALVATLSSVVSSLDYNYSRVLELSLLFYEAQRSGPLPPDNRIPWRGDSALGDRGQNGEDLTGGYYDGKHELISYKWELTFKSFFLLSY